MLTLEWPWLLLIAPLPWLIRRVLPVVPREDAALRIPFFDQLTPPPLPKVTDAPESFILRRPLLELLIPGVLWLIWLLLVTAAARPLWIGEPMPIAGSGRDLMLAVDISGSMEQEDMKLDGEATNRLAAVKSVLEDFIQRRSGDRLGLILFGSNAYIQTPLTFDHQTLNRLLQEAQIGFAGKRTSIGDAIGLGIKRLKERPTQSRVLILLTDGANTAGQVTPLEAAKKAAQASIRIYTLGFGADEMLVQGLFGVRRVNPSSDLDEVTLKGIASATGGRYFRARNTEELQEIYRELNQLEPALQDQELIRPQQSLFHWPLAVAWLLSLLWALTALLPLPRTIREDL